MDARWRVSRRGHGRTRFVAVALAVALVASGCAGGDATPAHSEATPTTGPEPELISAPTEWDDGFDHVVVLTSAAATSQGAQPATDEPAIDEPATDEPATDEPLIDEAPPTTVEATPNVEADPGAASSSQAEVRVERADGTSEQRTIPDESLPVVLALTQVESDALDAFADETLALLVEDVTGAVGPAGTRYVMVPGRLIEVSPPRPEPVENAAAPDSAPTTSQAPRRAPTTRASTDEDILAVILDLPGVESAVIVAPGVIAVATSGNRDDLRRISGVVSVEDDTLFDVAEDPGQAQQWWVRNTGAASQAGGWSGTPAADANVEAGWQVSRGAGAVVAVIDSGVDMDHVDLSSRIWVNAAETCGNGVDDDRNGFVDDCRGWDFGANDSDPRPDGTSGFAAHGTHVAGAIAAARNGVGTVGIAPEAHVMALKIASPSGQLSSAAIYSAIVYAADKGADVINLSLGTAPGTSRAAVATMELAIQYARDRGVVVVAASGNAGADIGVAPVWPANFSTLYDHVITVGASTNSDTQASFSNFGSPVSLVAPGFFNYSTMPGSTWNFMSGTSMAAPIVAGAVADVIASGQLASPAAIRARLVERAKPTAAGPRLDLGLLLGVGVAPTIAVTYRADRLAADTVSPLSIDIRAENLPATTTRARISLATKVGNEIYAVAGFPARFDLGGATSIELTSDDAGAFPPIVIRDPAMLATTGWLIDATMNLPAGEHAVITELVDDAGNAVGGGWVAYLSIPAPGSADEGTTVTTVGPGSPPTTAPGVTQPPPAGGDGPAPGSGGVGTTLPGSQTTLPLAPGVPESTLPSTSPPTPATTTPGSPTPGTSPGTTQPAAGAPVTTAPANSGGNGGNNGGGGPGTTTAPTSPTNPTTTMPAPAPDTSGPWRLDSIAPQSGTTAGDTNVVLSGNFPTNVAVYVWFGDLGIIQATSTGSTLTVRSPAVPRASVVDVSVKFRTSVSHTLTLVAAFTFVSPPLGSPGTATTQPSAVTTNPSTPGGGGSPIVTTAPPAASPSPNPKSPPATSPSPTSPVTTSPSPTNPPATSPAVTSPATPTTMPTVGSLTLRPKPTSGPISRLAVATWPPGCQTTCPATTI
jgi:serine protease